jgi:nitrite reductase/ring-hydroxylating ferredoxin subunit/uncharacterized membrane protein
VKPDDLARSLEQLDAVDPVAGAVSEWVNDRLPPGPVKDLLSGTWLGHPLHPMLIVLPLGSWASATVLDLVGGRRSRKAADRLVGIGVLAAAPTAAAGLSDWADTVGKARRVGVFHALFNYLAVTLYALSWWNRRRGRRARGVAQGLMGFAAVGVSGYLGGHLSYNKGVGVDATVFDPVLEDFTAACPEASLAEGTPTRVDVGGAAVMLLRRGPEILALSDTCTHRGGPLSEGKIIGNCVECPWHASHFDLHTGEVMRGPATAPERRYEVRVEGGTVLVRDARSAVPR